MAACLYRIKKDYATIDKAAQTANSVWVVSRVWVLKHPDVAHLYAYYDILRPYRTQIYDSIIPGTRQVS